MIGPGTSFFAAEQKDSLAERLYQVVRLHNECALLPAARKQNREEIISRSSAWRKY